MPLDTTLKNISITALFAVLFVPLIVANEFFFPFITGKAFFFRVFVEIAFASYVVLAVRSPQYRPKFSYIAGGLGAFLVVMAIATVFAENPFKAFWSNFERMEGYITLLHLGAYFIALGSVLNTEKLWMRFFSTSVGVAAFVGLYGLLQLLCAMDGVSGCLAGNPPQLYFQINQGGVRLDATFGNAAYLAVYMLLHIFITIFVLIRSKVGTFRFYALLLALLLEGIAIYFTETRGALLGLVVGGFVAALISLWGKEYPRVRIIASGLLVFIIIFVGAVFMFKESSFVANNGALARFATISLSAGETRFTIWNLAYEGFKERPLFGWGQEGFNYVFNKYYKPSLWSQEPWFDRAHSIFLDWLIAGGILGLLGYLSLYVFMVYLIWFGTSNPFTYIEKALLTGLIAGYFVNNIFVFDNIGSYITFFALLAYVHHRFAQSREWKVPSKEEKQMWTRIAAPVMGILLIIALYFGNVQSMRAASSLIRGLMPVPGGYEKNLEYFKTTLGHFSLGIQEEREQLMQKAINVNSDQAAPIEIKQAFFTYAKQQIDEHIVSFPGDARIHVFYGSFMRIYGQMDESVKELTKAHELSPGKQTILVELALSHLAKGDVETAVVTAKKAHEMDATYDVPRVMYAAILMYANNQNEADRLLTERFNTPIVDNEILLQAYLDTKQFSKVLEVWKARAKAAPNDANALIGLGRAYLISGDKANAIKSIEEAIRLEPQFKEQGEGIIKDIREGKM